MPPTAPKGGKASPPTVVTVTADWNDVDTSVAVAVGQVEMAVLSVDASDPLVRRYQLRTSTDRGGTLIAERDEPGEGESVPITLTASIGVAGDDRYQEALLRYVTRRLEQLRGRDVAPISW